MYSLSIRYRNIKQFDKTERSESVRPPWPQDMQWKMSTNHCVQKKWLNIETLYSFLLIRSSWKSGYCNINHLLRKKLFPMTRLYSFHKGFRSEYADPFPSLRSALKLFFFLTLLMAKYLLLISLTIPANIANHQDRSFTLYSASKETSKKFDFLGEKKKGFYWLASCPDHVFTVFVNFLLLWFCCNQLREKYLKLVLILLTLLFFFFFFLNLFLLIISLEI